MIDCQRIKFCTSTMILIAIISLAAMNFMLYGSYLMIIAFIAVVLFNNGKIRANITSFLLIGLALCYILTVLLTTGNFEPRVIAAPCAYLVAFNIGNSVETPKVRNLFIIIAFFMAVHSILSFAYTANIKGFDFFSTGLSYDFWSKSLSTATGIATYYYFLVATVPILFSQTKLKLKIFHVLIFIISMVHDILIGGRTCIVLCAVAIAISVFVRIFAVGYKKSALKYIISIIVVLILLFLAYENNWFQIRSTFETSYMFRRFFMENAYEEIGSTSRWERKFIYIKNIFNYPFGGNHLRNDLGIGYAHDIWLDTFDDAGILTMILMLAYTIGSVFRFFRYAKYNNEDIVEKTTFYTFPIVMMAAFFVEPIMSGAPIVFFMYCFMDGLVSKKQKEMGLR